MEKRTFIGIPILADHLTIRVLEKTQTELGFRNFRWVSPSNFHVTLKFLGNTTEAQIEEIAAEIVQLAKGYSSFPFSVSEMGVFPNLKRPRVFWMGLKIPKQMVELAVEIDKICSRYGFPRENRPFNPHLTIARVKHPPEIQSLQEILVRHQGKTFMETSCKEIIFYESLSTPEGVRYSPLKRFPIKDKS